MTIFEGSNILIQLKEKKSLIERELRDIKDKISDIENQLSELFIDTGLSSIAINDKKVSLVETFRVSCDQSQDLVNYLEENGFDVFNKPINIQSLTKVVRENPEVEEEMANHLSKFTQYSFQVRKK